MKIFFNDIIYSMNPERKKRLRSIKVICSEALMVVVVVIMVVILAFLVSGYWINSDFEVDRQGLLQLSSIPTGATVTIDGVTTSWLERTNMSKNLSSGEHMIELTRDGYDTWSKKINVSEGLLYRIHYPRLFLEDREKEDILDTSKYSSASISPDHSYMILMNDTTDWNTVDLDNETIKPVKVNVANLFTSLASNSPEQKGLFTGEVKKIRWDKDSSHALFEAKFGDSTEWLLFDVKNPEKSINITKEFGGNYSDIQILDNSSNNLLVVQNNNLQRIDLGAKSISKVLVENINSFDHFNQNEVVFSALNPESKNAEDKYYVGTFKIGDNEIKQLETLESPAKVTLSKFYEDKYITVLEDKKLTVHKQDDFSEVAQFEITFSPDSMTVGHNGEFITMKANHQIATLDMESMSVVEWSAENGNFDWIDNDTIYVIENGELIVYDYDGFNRRVIANNVSSHFPAAITDDKWLYYFSDDTLVREWLIER